MALFEKKIKNKKEDSMTEREAVEHTEEVSDTEWSADDLQSEILPHPETDAQEEGPEPAKEDTVSMADDVAAEGVSEVASKGRDEEQKAKKKISFSTVTKTHKNSEDEDLEFITHESVRDKSKMANGEIIRDDMLSRKKTKRRSVDAEAAKKEKVEKMAKSHWRMILVGVVVVIAAVGVSGFVIRRNAAKKSADNTEQPISVQEYEKNGIEQINELVAAYYSCYADGDTDSILEYAYPMSDSEKSYIQMYSEYIDEYQNITCYTKTGEDDSTYIVSASFYVKYKDVGTTAAGMDFFYVRTDDSGNFYIDNTYSPFNLVYQEYALDQNVVQLISDYEAGEDTIALQAGVQTSYENALENDADLKTMVEETIANAQNTWLAAYQEAQQQKTEEAAQQVQEEQEQQAAEEAAAEQAAAEAQAAAEQAEANAETENKAWVYVNDTVNIREEPSESSTILASAIKGSEVRQLATTNSGWSKVKTGDIVGYIKSEYISTEPVNE